MRFPHWLKTVASALVLTATAGPALAQGPGTPGGGQPMYQPAYSTNDPGVLYPQGTPSNYQPYPTISPYGMGNVAWDQTFRDNNGLWFERIMHTNRDYFASLDVTYNHIRSPGSAELGSAHVPFDYITNGLQGFNIPTYGQGGNPGTTAGGGNNAAGSAIPAGRTIVAWGQYDSGEGGLRADLGEVQAMVSPSPFDATALSPPGAATTAARPACPRAWPASARSRSAAIMFSRSSPTAR